jgi:hypothetical protein
LVNSMVRGCIGLTKEIDSSPMEEHKKSRVASQEQAA